MQLVQPNGAAIFALAPPRRTRHDKHRPCQTAVDLIRASINLRYKFFRRWITGSSPVMTISIGTVIARSESTKQCILFCIEMDCLAEPVIGRAFARPVGSQ